VRDTWEKKLSFFAAGAAFNTFLAIVAGMTVLVSLSILLFGAETVQARLGTVQVPDYVMKLLSDPHSRRTLRTGLLISVGIDLWTVFSGSACILTALTLVYGEKNKRSFLHSQLATLTLAAIMVPFGLVSLVLIAVLPGVIDSLALSWFAKMVISAIRWPILVALFMTMLAAIYRHAPHRAEQHWQWASWGAVIATALWIAGSAGFSFYMSEFLSRDQSYGALGTVMLLLAWLDATAFIVLLGAQINSKIEQERLIV
jgi:membrane protein